MSTFEFRLITGLALTGGEGQLKSLDPTCGDRPKPSSAVRGYAAAHAIGAQGRAHLVGKETLSQEATNEETSVPVTSPERPLAPD